LPANSKKLYFCREYQTKNRSKMNFTEQIKQLHGERQMPQRQFAAALEIDTATCCKVEKVERRVKAEQVVVMADLLQADKDELLKRLQYSRFLVCRTERYPRSSRYCEAQCRNCKTRGRIATGDK
jgi:DNA-binding transcriptional regulator YiaG